MDRGRVWFARINVVKREHRLLGVSPAHREPRTVRAAGNQIGTRPCRTLHLVVYTSVLINDVHDFCRIRIITFESDGKVARFLRCGKK